MAEGHHGRQDDEEFSPEERRFIRRWRQLADQAGGQKVLVNHIVDWSKSTVSRDYTGGSLPTDERVRQLCAFLKLGRAEQEELWGLLEQARSARRARKQDSGRVQVADGEPRPALGDEGPGEVGDASHARPRSRRNGRVAALVGAVGVITAAIAVSLWQPWSGAGGVRGSFPGIGVKTVTISVRSLLPALASQFHQGRTSRDASVTGYVFRNSQNTRLCLTAVDTGSSAGKNGDRVEIDPCIDGARNQVWIPEQWETNDKLFTRLVSYRYQSMCLNARNVGGMGNRQRTQLWDCYSAANESWDFGDWLKNTQPGKQAYPIFVESAQPLCLDADEDNYGAGAKVQLWMQYAAPNQFWS